VKSVEFRREREASWRELQALVERIERGGPSGLSPVELGRLPVLYRSALSSLSVARAIALDRSLLEYLEALSARAYFCVYAPQGRLRQLAGWFLSSGFPRALRAHGRQLAAALLVTAIGFLTGQLLVQADPDRFYSLVDPGMADGRDPAASTEELRQALYHPGARPWLIVFAMVLFDHNARLALMAAALGFLAGLPTLYLLYANGVTLGAFAALYGSRGLWLEFWAWILPHGITEIGAIVVCGAAGLALAEGLLFPGRLTRLASLAARGRGAAPLVVGAVLMLFAAGLIEGIFRQTVSDPAVRLAVAALTAAGWVAYVGLAGRERS
jgi:uncharacterized membrane protein SpoIIM required for sporulation